MRAKPALKGTEAQAFAQAEAEAKFAKQKQYEAIQQQFQTALAANAPMILAQFASLSDMMEGWFSGMQGFDEPNFHGDCMLVVTELAEAVEADRTDSMSDKVPEFHGREEEIADALVRLFHLAGKYELKIGPAFVAKMQMNLQRPFKHGKEY
jgi:NTP pyrophosphatase (non-canonical NTP hydrolase)